MLFVPTLPSNIEIEAGKTVTVQGRKNCKIQQIQQACNRLASAMIFSQYPDPKMYQSDVCRKPCNQAIT